MENDDGTHDWHMQHLQRPGLHPDCLAWGEAAGPDLFKLWRKAARWARPYAADAEASLTPFPPTPGSRCSVEYGNGRKD